MDGVVGVNNRIQVSYASTWEQEYWKIEQDIESRFYWNPFIDEDEVSVREGVATLRGNVNSEFERDMAGQNALKAGSKRVCNFRPLEKDEEDPMTRMTG